MTHLTEEDVRVIREAVEKSSLYDFSKLDNLAVPVYQVCANAPEWINKLLQDRKALQEEYAEERAAHNEHATELCELEKENRKLREEREKWEKEARLQYRLFNEYHDESREKIEQLRAERAKLIEGLRWYADEDTHMIKRRSDGDYAPIVLDHGKRARDILKEIGVTDV